MSALLQSMNRLIRELSALFGGMLAALAVFAAAANLRDIAAIHFGLLISARHLAVGTAVASLTAFAFAVIFFRRRCLLPPFGKAVVIAVLVLVPYLATWAFGVPRVLSDFTSDEIATYKRLKAQGDPGVWEAHPAIHFVVSFPIAPAFIVTYHEFQLAGLYGAGVWELSLWYGVGSRPLAHYFIYES